MNHSIYDILDKGNSFCLRDFVTAWPDCSKQTVHNRIKALVREGKIYRTGRGLYTKGSRMTYRIPVSHWMKEVNEAVVSCCPGVNFCLTEKGGNLFVETSKADIGTVALSLRSKYPNVLERKSPDIACVNCLTGIIFVSELKSEAPVMTMDGVFVPSLEKYLVDSVVIWKGQDDSIRKAFQRAFELYSVNRNALIRYASRRNVSGTVNELMRNLNTERISLIETIREYFREQPVDRVWLFGSYSRGEEDENSDIDLMVDYTDSDSLSLLDVSRMMVNLKNIVNKDIDLVENGHLMPFATESVEQDKYLIYERTVQG